MRKIIILIFIIFVTNEAFCQDISGSWTWNEPDKSFVIELEQLSTNSYSGFHTAISQNGNRIDSSQDEKSILLSKVSNNIYEGTIKSGYSLSTHKVRITFNPVETSIEWCLFEMISGDFYIPRKVRMIRIGDE